MAISYPPTSSSHTTELRNLVRTVQTLPRQEAEYLAYIHECAPSEMLVMPSSHDVWSLGRLILEISEPWNTVNPKFKVGDVLKFENQEEWSSEANDFLRNTSTVSAEDLLKVCCPPPPQPPDSSLRR